jgi:hypothetical protein
MQIKFWQETPKGRDHLRGHRHRWEDNIKSDLKDIRYDDVEGINVAQDRDQ